TDVVPGDRLADRRGKIHVANAEIAGARIVGARLETRRWQFYKRMMLADSDRLRHGCHLPHERPGLTFAGESDCRLDFSVLWKVLCVREIERAARWIQTKTSLLRALQCAGNLMSVAQKRVCCIHQRTIAFFRRDFTARKR